MSAPLTDVDLEAALLGGLLQSPSHFVEALRHGVTERTFVVPGNRAVFRAIDQLGSDRLEGGPVVVVTAQLRKDGSDSVVGGAVGLARLIEVALAASNLSAAWTRLRDLEVARDADCQLAATRARIALEPERTREHLIALDLERLAPPNSRSRFAAAAVSGAELAALEISPPKSILGNRLLTAGGFGILYGKPGLGKTWLALLLARAIVRGEPWLGIPTTAARVGLIQLELSDFTLKERARVLGLSDNNFHLVCRPRLKGVVDLFRQPGQLEELRAWIRGEGLEVMMIDALSRAHTAAETAEELGQVLARLDELRFDTDCALMANHHERKPQNGAKDTDDDLDALRGTGRLASDPTLHIRVHRSRTGLRSLRFVRASEGPEPDPIYFQRGADGRIEVIDSPESTRDANREKVYRAVHDSARGIGRAEVETITGLGRSAASGHLKALLAEGRICSTGGPKAVVYYDPTVHRPPPSTESQVDGHPSMYDNDMRPIHG